jgi:hypothetical protein
MRPFALAFLLGLAFASPAGAQDTDSTAAPKPAPRPRIAAPT